MAANVDECKCRLSEGIFGITDAESAPNDRGNLVGIEQCTVVPFFKQVGAIHFFLRLWQDWPFKSKYKNVHNHSDLEER
jgi:hypothetical protein